MTLAPTTYSLCVHAEHLTFTYPGFDAPALQDLSLGINVGESLAILGSNGSGKSTLAKLLAGLLCPSSGSLEVLGQNLCVPDDRAAISGQVGIVFQSPDTQMVATTVEREIAFGLENLGIPSDAIRSRVDEFLERFNLTSFAQRAPHLLSGGEKQRVALASVLAMQPKLLILDEVTSLLDPIDRLDIGNLILELKTNCTLILITQFPNEALITDRLILMHDGRIVKDASPQDVFTDVDSLNGCGIESPLAFRLLKAAECAENPRKSN